MEDVLLSYLQSRMHNPGEGSIGAMPVTRNHQAGNPASEPVSWTAPGQSSPANADPMAKPSLPFPLSGLFTLVDSCRDYPEACAELAEFLKKLCGQHPLEDLMSQTIQARFPRVWMERFLFTLLEVQPSDCQTAAYVLQFRHLKRLLLRVERKMPLNAIESGLARELINALSLSGSQDLDPFCRRAAETCRTMQASRIPVSGDLGLLVYLIRSECAAMGERKNWLENNLAPGDSDSVARLTPHLKLLEDRIHKAQELLKRIGSCGPMQVSQMGLEESMGPFFFNHLKECLLKSPSLAGLSEVLTLQKAKRVPTRDLIALSTLCRWLMEAKRTPAGPVEWVRMALESYDRGHFLLDVAGGLPAVEALLQEAKVEREGTLILGNFGENPYSSWIARDELTRPYRSSNPYRNLPDLKSLVLANLHRDTVIIKLLDDAKVQTTPGLIQAIVEGSRSPLVHEKIATRPELHTGRINYRIPLSLLRSPVSISPAVLRSLIDPTLISFSDMKSLYRGHSALRPEVAEELHRFLKRAYAL